MRRALLVAATAALALAAAPAAGAKEIDKAEVCGQGACASIDDEASRIVLLEGGPPGDPPAAAPYYDVRFQVKTDDGGQETFGFVAVPSKRAYRTHDGEWWKLTDEMLAVIRKRTAGTRAFPAAGMMGGAPPPAPKPAPAPAASDGGGSLLWPEGVLVALVLAAGGVLLVRAARGSGRFRPASS